MEKSEGFPPIANDGARVLVLGSLPGQKSITEQQYYAHPQNAFWKIMRDVFGVAGDYLHRCEQLACHGVAVWDVLHSSVRPGSLDANILLATAMTNDFGAFFSAQPDIERVLCNGQMAGRLFNSLVVPELDISCPVHIMPSTSPAYAAMSYDVKLKKWRAALTACRQPV